MMTCKQKFVGALFVAIAFCLLISAPAVAQRGANVAPYLKSNGRFKRLFREVVQEAQKSTVQIKNDDKSVALGTVVDAKGLVLTKSSLIGDNPTVVLKYGDETETLKAKVIGRHEEHDLALLKVDAMNLTSANWRPSKEVPVGHWAVSVGTGKDPLTLGVVSVAMRKVRAPRITLNQGVLGVMIAPGENGAKIDEVMPKSGAAAAGLKRDDIILSIEGKMVKDAETVRRTLAKFRAGESVKFRILRGKKEFDKTAKLQKRKLSRGQFQNKMGSSLSKRISGFPVILQHDGVIDPMLCGGPLVDLDGKVIGINIARAGRTESYAIPTEIVLPLLKEMKAGKHKASE